jgi:hypothetical protein
MSRMALIVLIVLVFVSLVAGCGSDDQDAAERRSPTPEATGTPTSTRTQSNTLVGRWELSRTCEGMVKALDQAGLRAGLAGHMAAVAYAGHVWKRVDCEGWC